MKINLKISIIKDQDKMIKGKEEIKIFNENINPKFKEDNFYIIIYKIQI